MLGLLSAGAWLYQCRGALNKPGAAEGTKLTLAWRLHPGLWEKPFKEIENGLLQFKEAVNEIAMFDESLNHRTLLPPDRVREKALILRERISDFHRAGIPAVGINIYDDLGVRNFDGGYTFPYRRMTGHDGEKAEFCPCPDDRNFREYFLEKIRIYAETNPDFIWIDDDYRNYGKAGIRYSCFCDHCLERFGETGGRETLVKKLNNPKNQALREQWIRFTNNTLDELALDIRKTIDLVNPRIATGFMTVGYDLSTYAYDFPSWMRTMQATRARPGHGYYHEGQPKQIIDKIMDAGRQVRDYPAITTNIQYELENWTYTTLDKSVQTELNESLLSLMAGCNGIAYNVIYAGEWEEKKRTFRAIASHRPLWEKVCQLAGGLPLHGFWPADHPDLFLKQETGPDGWFHENYNVHQPNELAALGVPFTFSPSDNTGTLLSGKFAEGFSRKELRDLLSAGVYMDGEALDVVWKKGLGELTGVRHNPERHTGVEVLTGHPVNGPESGNGRRAGAWGSGTTLVPLNDRVQQLSKLHTMAGDDRGCCLSICENEAGGRVAVSSYFPWNDHGREGKRNQIMEVMDWISRNRMPVKIGATVRVLPMIRMNPDRDRFLLLLFNNSLDEITNLPVRIRSSARKVRMTDATGERRVSVRKTGDGLEFLVDRIPPWNCRVLAGDAG